MGQQIEMNIKTSSGYTTLYPNIVSNNVVDFSGTNPLLSDSTKTSLGLPTSATPDDAFKFLANYNLYYWEKTQYTQKLIQNTYTWQSDSQRIGALPYNETLQYSNSYVINSDNTFALNSPQTIVINFNGSAATAQKAAVLANKYVLSLPDTTKLYYVKGAPTSHTINGGLYGGSGNIVYQIQDSFGATTFVSNSSATAYPNNEISNGYRYVALGQVFSKLPQMLRYDKGSYIGTGTAPGSQLYVGLQLKFFPQFIFIRPAAPPKPTRDYINAGAIIIPSNVSGRRDQYFEMGCMPSNSDTGTWGTGLNFSYGSNGGSQYYIEGNTLYHRLDVPNQEYWYYMFG